jgi:hypothetical protein
MSKIEVNTVAPQCGTTLTLGESGDTVVLGTGASQTGFGRTGTVDWQTGSIKTSTFTAVNGQGFFANTSGSAFTMNLPAGTAGNIVSVVDYTNTFQTNNLTITPNGSQKIGGIAASFIASTEGQSLTFVYVDDTEGWKNVQDSTSNATGNPFLIATGGTETTSGNCKIHTFTGPGTFTVSTAALCAANNVVSYLVVGGGGAGGTDYGGGGGAGGFREAKSPVTPYTASPLDGYPSAPNRITVTATAFPITVGAGGSPVTGTGSGGAVNSNPGNVSTFSTISSAGGGRGGSSVPSHPNPVGEGGPGGSGGGGSWDSPGGGTSFTGGTGNTPPVSPAQGTNGGRGKHVGPSFNSQGGGGGATAVGQDANPGVGGGTGGAGATTSITGTPTAYAGGGGGTSAPGAGGTGGGGTGNPISAPAPTKNGTDNTGGGGGGQGYSTASGAGGSGVVIIRYKIQ